MLLTSVHPKLPMRNKAATRNYYLHTLDFQEIGSGEFDDYLIVQKDGIELHFFLFKELDPKENYGQVYIRVDGIEALYQSFLHRQVSIHPNGALQLRPWGQKEFAVLDPDNNLLTFGEGM